MIHYAILNLHTTHANLHCNETIFATFLGECQEYATLTIGPQEVQTTFKGLVKASDNEHALVFGMPSLMAEMQSKSEIHMDGTFQVVPKLAYQLLSIGFISHDHFIPALHILMTKKTEKLYVAVFEHVRGIMPNISPNLVVMDFEAAMIGAVSEVFPDTEIQGCFFHFAQAVLRKFRSLGLHAFFVRTLDARRFLRHNLSVAMLPPEYIPEAIDVHLHPGAISSQATPAEQDMLNNAHAYMVQQWKPKAAVVSVFGCPRRTNNSMESMHSVMLKRFGTHPSFWKFCNSLQDAMRSAVLNARRLENGLRLGRLKKPQSMERDSVIHQLSQELRTGRISYMEYLASVSHRVAAGIIDRELGVVSEQAPAIQGESDASDPAQPAQASVSNRNIGLLNFLVIINL